MVKSVIVDWRGPGLYGAVAALVLTGPAFILDLCEFDFGNSLALDLVFVIFSDLVFVTPCRYCTRCASATPSNCVCAVKQR